MQPMAVGATYNVFTGFLKEKCYLFIRIGITIFKTDFHLGSYIVGLHLTALLTRGCKTKFLTSPNEILSTLSPN